MLNAKDVSKIYIWLESKKPGARISELQSIAEQEFGPIKWGGQMGWGEGMITCEFTKHNIEGRSSGLCTSEEALLEALNQLI